MTGVVVVTGAASGIGRAIARRLIRDGYIVCGIDRDGQLLAEVRSEAGDSFRAFTADVSDSDSLADVFEQLDEEFGSIGALINSAAVGSQEGDVVSTSPEAWARTLAVNLTGVFLASRLAVPLIERGGGGAIVHISSVLGLVGTTGSPDYSASKGGVIALGRSMALDHAAQNITVNVVCPGPIETPLLQASVVAGSRAELVRQVPLGRIGTPEDVAALVSYLISADATFMTGSVLTVDGGWTAI